MLYIYTDCVYIVTCELLKFFVYYLLVKGALTFDHSARRGYYHPQQKMADGNIRQKQR